MVRMNKLQKDALDEITNMFSNHILIALEKLTRGDVKIEVNKKQIISLEKLDKKNDKSPLMYLGIYSNIQKGNLDGNVLVAFPKDSALLLYDKLIKKKKGTTKVVDDEVKNVLGEIGNVVTGNMLGVLNKLLGINCIHSIPTVVPSFGEQIYDFVFFDIEEDRKKAMLIEVDTKFNVEGSEIAGQSILLLTHKSFEKLLSTIKDKTSGYK